MPTTLHWTDTQVAAFGAAVHANATGSASADRLRGCTKAAYELGPYAAFGVADRSLTVARHVTRQPAVSVPRS